MTGRRLSNQKASECGCSQWEPVSRAHSWAELVSTQVFSSWRPCNLKELYLSRSRIQTSAFRMAGLFNISVLRRENVPLRDKALQLFIPRRLISLVTSSCSRWLWPRRAPARRFLLSSPKFARWTKIGLRRLSFIFSPVLRLCILRSEYHSSSNLISNLTKHFEASSV